MAAIIHDDIKCSGCGYNLRTLREDGDCPECGEPIVFTLERLHRKSEATYGCTKSLALFFPILYVLWVGLGMLMGGEGGGFFALMALAPFVPILKLLGIPVMSEGILCLLAFPIAPLVYAGIGALIGWSMDSLLNRYGVPPKFMKQE